MNNSYSDEYLLVSVDEYGMSDSNYRFTFRNLSNRYLDSKEVIKCHTGPRKLKEVMTLQGKKKKWEGYANFETNGWEDVLNKGVGHVYTFASKMYNPLKHSKVTDEKHLPDFEIKLTSSDKGQTELFNADSIPVWVREHKTTPDPKKEFLITVDEPEGMFTWKV